MLTKTQLDAILEAHRAWLAGSPSGSRADLSEADLREADLSKADLSKAYLIWADLNGANLSRADLSGADLRKADLIWADLSRADLSGANLSRANLRGADLSGANLSGADMCGADLCGANLSGATLTPRFICPEFGEFLAFKKLEDGIIATLRIPENARRVSSLVSKKCRAEFAEVVALDAPDGSPVERGVSQYDDTMEYVVGQTVRPDGFNSDIRLECAPGIHFFVTRAEAEAY